MEDLIRRWLLSIAAVALCLGGAELTAGEQASARPNIIVILADDMGFSDLGCFGGEIPTPNLDGLAARGVRFSEFYNTSRCCPSRAALLTGLYPHQAGVGNMTKDEGVPGYEGRLNRRCVTIAEVLQQAGYFTAMVGKWHVGGDEFHVTPWDRGFSRSLSAKAGGFYFGKAGRGTGPLWLDGRNLAADSPELPPNWYTTDLFTDFGIKFIQEAMAQRKPFFLYLAHTAPHWPLQVPVEEVAKFRGKYRAGWDQLRRDRFERQLRMGLIDSSWPLSPRPGAAARTPAVPAWDTLSEQEKDRYDHIMAVYAAVVARMDQAIGRIVAELDKQHVLEDTLILFLSDNGGSAEGGAAGKLEGKSVPGAPQSRVWAGASWAMLQNTPFRYSKSFAHEGGIATPLIAHWPKGIRRRGAVCREQAHIIDLMATCLDVAGARYPGRFNGNPIIPTQGRSLIPAFSGGKVGHDALYWEHNGKCAVREDDWKLVRLPGEPWELYNLRADRTELNNLANQHPERRRDLEQKWNGWAERTGVFPKPGKQPR